MRKTFRRRTDNLRQRRRGNTLARTLAVLAVVLTTAAIAALSGAAAPLGLRIDGWRVPMRALAQAFDTTTDGASTSTETGTATGSTGSTTTDTTGTDTTTTGTDTSTTGTDTSTTGTDTSTTDTTTTSATSTDDTSSTSTSGSTSTDTTGTDTSSSSSTAAASGAPPTAGLAYVDKSTDKVGTGSGSPDGHADGHFRVTVTASDTVTAMSLQTTNSDGLPCCNQIWKTAPRGTDWILGVFRSGTELNPTDQALDDPVSGTATYDVYGSDSGYFVAGQNFLVTITLASGTTITAAATVPAQTSPLTVTGDTSLAAGGTGSYSVAGTSAGDSLSWDFGDGSAAVVGTATSESHTYASTGSYTITVTDQATGAQGTLDVTVSAASLTVTGDTSLQTDASGSWNVSGEGAGDSLTWDFGDGSDTVTSSSTSQSHSYTAIGEYTITVTDEATGATGTIDVAVTTPPPANDNLADAATLDGASGTLDNGSNAGATVEPAELDLATANDLSEPDATVWYAWTAPADGTADFAIGSGDFVPQFQVFSGDGTYSGLTYVATGQPPAFDYSLRVAHRRLAQSTPGEADFQVTSGATYYIEVESADGNTGTFSLQWSSQAAVQAPANDNLANATPISGNTGSGSGTVAGATVEQGEPSGPAGTDGGTVWWKWSSSFNGVMRMTNPNNLIATVFSGPASSPTFDSLTVIDAVSYGALDFGVESGKTYYIRFDGNPNSGGSFSFNWNATAASGAVQFLNGCTDNTLFRNDDGSTNQIQLPFAQPIDFFGQAYTSLWVNNNGDVTFNGALSTYTPFNLVTTGTPIIAPYFADVDTRNAESGQVHYGNTTFEGHQAFCVLWTDVGYGKGVGYYGGHADRRNSFQLLLVDRSDTGAGNFDIVFNYDNMQWETGDASGGSDGLGGSPARVGYSNGDRSNASSGSFELSGSGVSGSFLDSNPGGLIYHSLNSSQPGRYRFPVRNGAAPTGNTIAGRALDASGNAVAGALVTACFAEATPSGHGGAQRDPQADCPSTVTGQDGSYAIGPLSPGGYILRAFPPAQSTLLPATAKVTLGSEDIDGENLVLNQQGNGQTFTVNGCANGTGTYTATRGSHTIASGSLAETPAGSGTYVATLTFDPRHGNVTVTATITCPDNGGTTTASAVFADPSGVVQDSAGNPVSGATVTLYKQADDGSFQVVPSGSSDLSSASPTNPETTDSTGAFGWDVTPGTYEVTASSSGCTSASSGPVAVTSSNPVSGLTLTLGCGPTLQVSSSASPHATSVGHAITFTFVVTNTGVGPATNVAFVATLPAGAVLTEPLPTVTTSVPSAPRAQAEGPSCSPTLIGGDVNCALGSVNPGQTDTVTFAAIPTRAGSFPSTGSATSAEGSSASPSTAAAVVSAPSSNNSSSSGGTTTTTPTTTGTTTGTTQTGPPPPPPPPPAGNAAVQPVSGTVLVNGQPLSNLQTIPVGATIDATNGIVQITTVGANGQGQTAYFFGGVFQIQQVTSNGATILKLQGGDFDPCSSPKAKTTHRARHLDALLAKGPKAKGPKSSKGKKSTKVIRSLWGEGKGNFRTQGKYASATVRGTFWLTADRCDGTLVKVNQGLVSVLNLATHRTILLHAGQSYLAPAP